MYATSGRSALNPHPAPSASAIDPSSQLIWPSSPTSANSTAILPPSRLAPAVGDAVRGTLVGLAADDEDEDEDGWSSADEDSELLRDDQTCLRGGDTAAPRTLIETLNSAALRRVLRYSGIAYSVAIVYAVVLIVLGHVYAAKVPLSQIFPGNDGLVMELEVLPPALMVVHMVIGVVLGVAIVCAAVALSAHVWAVPRARRADEQVWTIVLLWSAAIYAVPVTEYEALSLFRLFASPNNVEESGEASKLLFVFLSMGSVAFAAFILWYGSTSVASFRKLDGSNRRVRFYLPRTVLLVVHVALRINAFVSLPGTEVAFSVFPLASVAYLLRLVVARPVAAPLTDDPWSMAAAVVVITVEGVLVAVLLAEMRVTGYVLKQTSFVRTRRKHIAHRFYALHARRMALAASLCVLVTAVAPPIGLTIWLHREGVFLWLTEPLGHGPPFRLLVSTYVLVEALLALPPHVTGVRALFSRPQRLAKAGGEEEVTDECSSNASIASSKSSTPEGGAGGEAMPAGGAAAYRTRLREVLSPLPGDGGGRGAAVGDGGDADGRRGRSPGFFGGRRASGAWRVGGHLGGRSPRQHRRRLHIQPGTFVLTTTAKLLNLSWLAYDEPPPPTPYLCPRYAWAATDPIASVKRIYHGPSDTLVLFIALPDRLVVSFRGTVSTTNTWTDLAFSLIPLEAVLGADAAAAATMAGRASASLAT